MMNPVIRFGHYTPRDAEKLDRKALLERGDAPKELINTLEGYQHYIDLLSVQGRDYSQELESRDKACESLCTLLKEFVSGKASQADKQTILQNVQDGIGRLVSYRCDKNLFKTIQDGLESLKPSPDQRDRGKLL